VYAEELRQHPRNECQTLSDPLDEVNAYLIAKVGDDIVGFVADLRALLDADARALHASNGAAEDRRPRRVRAVDGQNVGRT
jgi:hypothetical protein